MLTPLALARKIRGHFHLLRHDPEKFAANLLQFTNPGRFQDKLIDVVTAAPLQVRVERALAGQPALNVLQPILSPASMTGGPNTVVNIAFWMAKLGIPVRLVTTRGSADADATWFWQHVASVTGDAARPDALSVAFAGDPGRPVPIGPRDMFLATHWTIAQQVRVHLRQMDVKRFFYLIQDFEPGFYAWSSNHALALETYGLDHIGVFNERLLFDYVVSQRAGRYADPGFARQSLVFEPAINRTLFHPAQEPRTSGRRRLLFYTRPTNPRNMLGLGLSALRAAIAEPVFQQAEWDFLAIGSRGGLPEIPIRPGQILRPVPWADYAGYARQLRESDILLCPMLSPHTSYPVLEMAASGGISVTNSFATKTAEKLMAMSANIIAVPPTEGGLTQGLIEAAVRVTRGVDIHAPLDLPPDWCTSLAKVVEQMAVMFRGTVADA